jgi:hypothetical protein
VSKESDFDYAECSLEEAKLKAEREALALLKDWERPDWDPHRVFLGQGTKVWRCDGMRVWRRSWSGMVGGCVLWIRTISPRNEPAGCSSSLQDVTIQNRATSNTPSVTGMSITKRLYLLGKDAES